MLVLTRKDKEQIDVLVDGVLITTITLVESENGRARIGLEGPETVIYRRRELGLPPDQPQPPAMPVTE